MPNPPVEFPMETAIPEIAFESLDIHWVCSRDNIARTGVARYGGKHYFFSARRGEVDNPVEYFLFELNAAETEVEYKVQELYLKNVDENNEYVANLRVMGGKTWSAKSIASFYSLIERAGMKKDRNYTARQPSATFRASL